MRYGVISLLLLPLPLFATPADLDNDNIPNALDNCLCLANNNQDTDRDGYGNACDGDFNQSGTVNATDYSMFFVPALKVGGDFGGTDMNSDNRTTATDFSMYFMPQLLLGTPGKSGRSCAGTAGCQ